MKLWAKGRLRAAEGRREPSIPPPLGARDFKRIPDALPEEPLPGQAFLSADPSKDRARRTEELEFPVKEEPGLIVFAACPGVVVSIDGIDTDTCSARLLIEADGATEAEARRRLEHTEMKVTGGVLRLSVSLESDQRSSRARLHIHAPRGRPVAFGGAVAAVNIVGFGASVNLVTNHAAVQISKCTGDIEATATDGGWITFVGHRGWVRLRADEIRTHLDDTAFDGVLEAIAYESNRVLLPPGFASPFEAILRSDRDFICRTAFRDLIERRPGKGATAFSNSREKPAVRLRCLQGTVVLDDTPAP